MLGVLWLTSCGALGTSGPEREWPEPSPALWEVTSPEGQMGWLFGTMHSLPDGLEWQTPEFTAAFAEADSIAVEVADLQPANADDIFYELALSPDQPRLSLRLEPDERPALIELMQRVGVSDRDFVDWETWAAALSLSNSLAVGDRDNGVDRILIAQAADSGTPIVGLETFRGQLSFFDGLSPDAQNDLLFDVAEEARDDDPDALTEDWLTGDLESLEREAFGALTRGSELRDVLVTRRNLAWLEVLVRMIEAGEEPFVAVGAGHMLGPDGLPALLEARGYTVTRIQ